MTDQPGRVAEPGLADQLGSAGFVLAGDGDADDLAVEDHVGADESLALEDGVPAMEPDGLGDEHEPVARPDLAAEPHVLHAAEGDEAVFVQPASWQKKLESWAAASHMSTPGMSG